MYIVSYTMPRSSRKKGKRKFYGNRHVMKNEAEQELPTTSTSTKENQNDSCTSANKLKFGLCHDIDGVDPDKGFYDNNFNFIMNFSIFQSVISKYICCPGLWSWWYVIAT